ncbi:DUF4142 domain-containing protein [Methylocapsa palsarum]|uniref:DUF4142 domain-containing protein n=1 Tax=Methylocapsa palsarum TaxID=1612308 RepID=UPI003CC7AD03
MNKTIVFGAMLLGLAGATVQAESVSEKTGLNSVLGVSPSTADFVKEAAISDLFEIQSSQLAKQQATGPVATFADQMIQDHTKTSNELKMLAQDPSVKVDVPLALDASHQKTLDSMKDAEGVNFIRTYANDQASGHKDAVSLFERYAKGGENAALKQWAARTLPALKHHLEMAEGLRNAGARHESENRGAMPGLKEPTGRSVYGK